MGKTAGKPSTLEGLDAVLERDRTTKQAYGRKRLRNMNAMAEALSKRGPTFRMTHFLFAMHGIDMRNRDSEVIEKYKELEGAFRVNHARQIYNLPEDRIGNRSLFYRMFSRTESRSEIDHAQWDDFSALEYHVERKTCLGDVDYIGKLLVPGLTISAETGEIEEGNALLLQLRRSDVYTEPVDVAPALGRGVKKVGDILYGSQLAAADTSAHVSLLAAQLQAITNAEIQLREALALR